MKLKLLTICLALISLNGCLTAEDIARQQKNVAALKEATARLQVANKRYEELKADYISGKVNLDVWAKKGLLIKDAIEDATRSVNTITEDVKNQKAEGQSWWEILLAGGLAIGIDAVVRGLPSKGMGGSIFNRLLPSRRKKD